MFSLIFFLPRLFRCDGDGEPSYPRRPDRSAREDERPARLLHHQVGHRVSVIRFSSLRLICLNLGASFFSYAISFIGLVHNTFLSTAMYMSWLSQHWQWFMCPFLCLNSFLRKILNDSANSPVMSEKVMSFVLRDSMNCLRLSCVVFDWR